MSAIEMAAIVIITLVVIAVIAEPFFRRIQEPVEPNLGLAEEAESLYRRKESAYSALKELEFDFKTGKLSQADFAELDAKYRGEALEALGAIDEYESEVAAAAAGARARRRKRASKPASASDSSGSRRRTAAAPGQAAQPAALDGSKTCGCGGVNVARAKFCTTCGEAFSGPAQVTEPDGRERLACADCGAKLEAGYRFCTGCGAPAGA